MKRKNYVSLSVVLAAALATASLCSVADNTYYRWSDDRGNPVHSDRPPPEGIDYEVVSTGSSLVRRVSAEEGAVPAETDSTPGNEFDATETAVAEAPKKNAEYCERAKANLNSLDTNARIRVRDDKGDYRYLSNEEKETERGIARDLIAVHCE